MSDEEDDIVIPEQISSSNTKKLGGTMQYSESKLSSIQENHRLQELGGMNKTVKIGGQIIEFPKISQLQDYISQMGENRKVYKVRRNSPSPIIEGANLTLNQSPTKSSMENSLDGDGNGQSSLINYSKFMKNTKFNHNNTSSHSRLAKQTQFSSAKAEKQNKLSMLKDYEYHSTQKYSNKHQTQQTVFMNDNGSSDIVQQRETINGLIRGHKQHHKNIQYMIKDELIEGSKLGDIQKSLIKKLYQRPMNKMSEMTNYNQTCTYSSCKNNLEVWPMHMHTPQQISMKQTAFTFMHQQTEQPHNANNMTQTLAPNRSKIGFIKPQPQTLDEAFEKMQDKIKDMNTKINHIQGKYDTINRSKSNMKNELPRLNINKQNGLSQIPIVAVNDYNPNELFGGGDSSSKTPYYMKAVTSSKAAVVEKPLFITGGGIEESNRTNYYAKGPKIQACLRATPNGRKSANNKSPMTKQEHTVKTSQKQSHPHRRLGIKNEIMSTTIKSFYLVSPRSTQRQEFFSPTKIQEDSNTIGMRETFISQALMKQGSFFGNQQSRLTQEEFSQIISNLVDKELDIVLGQNLNSDSVIINNSELMSQIAPSNRNHLVSKIAENIKRDLKEGDLMKSAFSPKVLEELANDIRLKYYLACRGEQITILPLLHKIKNKILNLTCYTVSGQLIKAFVNSLKEDEKLLNRIVLDSNSLRDEDLAYLLGGLEKLVEIKSIVCIRNEFMAKSAEQLLPHFTAKGIPHHLEELRLINCLKINSAVSSKLLESLHTKSFIKKLSLVRASINDEQCIKKLTSFMHSSRFLIELDISWNRIRPALLNDFLEALGENRQLHSLNLSWNNLMERADVSAIRGGVEDEEIFSELGLFKFLKIIMNAKTKRGKGQQLDTGEQRAFMMSKITRFIKYNKNLIHMDLSHTGLNESAIKFIAISLRKARSLVSLHLCGNLGITKEVKSYIFDRIRCKKIDNIFNNSNNESGELSQDAFEKSINIMIDRNVNYSFKLITLQIDQQELVMQALELNSIVQQKRQLDQSQSQTYKKDMINEQDSKLIFHRYLGHKYEIPGSGQWQMLTNASDQCWVCDKREIYSLLFWSQDIGIRTQIHLEYQDRHEILEKISIINKNNPLSTVDTPVICGTFTNWKWINLQYFDDFIEIIDIDREDERAENFEEFKHNLSKNDPFKRLKQALRRKLWREIYKKSVRYKQPLILNERYIPKDYQSQEANTQQNHKTKNDQKSEFYSLYCLPHFFKGGRHTYVVKLTYEGEEIIYFHKFITRYRTEDVPPFAKHTTVKVEQRVFKKDASVFKEWKEDTPAMLEKSATTDLQLWKASRFIKDEYEIEKCVQVVMKNIDKLKELFIELSSQSKFPNITWIDFSEFCEKTHIFDKNVTFATIDRLFIATNFEVTEMEDNPDRELCRYELYELLLRIGNAKYREPGIVQTYSQALEKLLSDNIFYYFDLSNWQDFRNQYLWTVEVNDTIEANQTELQKVYSHFFSNRKKFMSYQEAIDLFTKLTNLKISEKDATYCFGMSKMTVVDEIEDGSAKYKRLMYVEFLEMIGRVAYEKFRETEMDSLPLEKKIEFVIDELVAYVGETRKEVQITLDEQSCSDDEY